MAARARRTAAATPSAPLLRKRTWLAQGMRSVSRSATSTSRTLASPATFPSTAASRTAWVTAWSA